MISENAKYWIWLTLALGWNTPKMKKITELYPDVADFCKGGEREWRLCGFLHNHDIEKLETVPFEEADLVLQRCRSLNYSVLTIDDEAYPESLYHIYAPPAVLYIEGTLPDFSQCLSIGIVGTRRATRYGIENSYKIAYSLAKYGVTIVSGGALGVDCASHRGALAANGVTVCVRGCGINSRYLPDNAMMRRAITSRGAVISEYPPDEEPHGYFFPARNRIIAALSDGLLIIEAGAKSGSLITADLALEMGKELFALMGNNSPQNEGSNHRIKEGSAHPVTDFMDILAAFDRLEVDAAALDINDISMADIAAVPVKGKRTPKVEELLDDAQDNPKPKEKAKRKKAADGQPSAQVIKRKNSTSVVSKSKLNVTLRGESKLVYDYLTDEPVHIDQLAADLNLPVRQALSTLTFLEMNELVRSLPGRKFVLS